MKIKKRLLSFPVTVIGLVCVLVGIVCWNSYLNNKQHQLVLKQLTSSAVLLKQFSAEADEGLKNVIADKLAQLKHFEINTDRLDHFSLLASIFILIGALLLGTVFFFNLNDIANKLNRLSMEVKQISRTSLDDCDLNYTFYGDSDNEIDGLANDLEHVIRDFKKSIREKNGQLVLLRKSNTELKQQLGRA